MGAGLYSHLLAQRRLRANMTEEQKEEKRQKERDRYNRRKEHGVQKKKTKLVSKQRY